MNRRKNGRKDGRKETRKEGMHKRRTGETSHARSGPFFRVSAQSRLADENEGKQADRKEGRYVGR
jgi:hypothetical protein